MTTYRDYYTRQSKPSALDLEFWANMKKLSRHQFAIYAVAIKHGATAEQAMILALEPPPDECTCFLPEMTCPTCAPAHDETEPIPF